MGEHPKKAQTAPKGWIRGKEECTDKDVREFVTLVQSSHLKKGIDLDHGARVMGGAGIRVADLAPSTQITENTE